MTKLLDADSRDRLVEDASHGQRVAASEAQRMREWLAALDPMPAKPEVMKQIEAAVGALEKAADHLQKVIEHASNDSSVEMLMYLLDRFYQREDARHPPDHAAFMERLAVVLGGAGYPHPSEVLHTGALTSEEVAAVQILATNKGLGLGQPLAALVDGLVKMGLPDIRTAAGKARVDLFPVQENEGTARGVAARIAGRSSRQLRTKASAHTATVADQGNVFTSLAVMATEESKPKK